MSRRALNPAAERAAQNQQTIKSLLKLESNKTCADCKRNKHPRWASWNLGIFICIRCSGIHRGMGTHISRVKSVDLDSWTDEQLQSVLKWGNGRANKYWEAKLAPGHVPSEAKIENFIRTKYESKRWVMDGPIPDPSTLDADGDDDVPLNLVQEKAKLDRSTSLRTASNPAVASQVRRQPQQQLDLFGDDNLSPPVRPSTTEPQSRPLPRAPQAAPKPTRPADSLLGLDFFGGPPPAAGPRPSSTASTPTSSSRPDLKQSILSLYASAPKPQPTQQTTQQASGNGFAPPTAQPASKDAFSNLTDAFGGLTFPSASSTQPPAPRPSAFSDLGSLSSAPKAAPAAPKVTSPPPLSGGSFFDPPKPVAQSRPPPPVASSSGFGDLDFGGFVQSTPAPAKPAPVTTASNDFFGLSSPSMSTSAAAPKPAPAPAASFNNSAFNLSSPAAQPPAPRPAVTAASSTAMFGGAMSDPWGDNAWSTPDPAPAPAAPKPSAPSAADSMRVPATLTANDFGSGWGAPAASKPAPVVSGDEDFGGWASAAPAPAPVSRPTAPSSANTAKPSGGFGGSDDLFSNVWE